MERIDQEKEYIILLSIARYGYAAISQDYNFLSRHAMRLCYGGRLDIGLYNGGG